MLEGFPTLNTMRWLSKGHLTLDRWDWQQCISHTYPKSGRGRRHAPWGASRVALGKRMNKQSLLDAGFVSSKRVRWPLALEGGYIIGFLKKFHELLREKLIWLRTRWEAASPADKGMSQVGNLTHCILSGGCRELMVRPFEVLSLSDVKVAHISEYEFQASYHKLNPRNSDM